MATTADDAASCESTPGSHRGVELRGGGRHTPDLWMGAVVAGLGQICCRSAAGGRKEQGTLSAASSVVGVAASTAGDGETGWMWDCDLLGREEKAGGRSCIGRRRGRLVAARRGEAGARALLGHRRRHLPPTTTREMRGLGRPVAAAQLRESDSCVEMWWWRLSAVEREKNRVWACVSAFLST